MNRVLFFLEKYLVALLVMILGLTFRFRINQAKPNFLVIYAFWHRDMIPLLYLRKFEKNVILISTSKDGELIAGPAQALGYKTARGSSRRNGSAGFREMIKLAKKHSLAITPDGPKGPRKKIKKGLLHLAYVTGLPIIPVAVDIEWEKVFDSWDRFRFPYPFTRINLSYGKQIHIKTKMEIEPGIELVQKAMNELEEKNKLKEVKQ